MGNYRLTHRSSLWLFVWLVLSFSASSAKAITCADVRQLIYGNFLRMHFSAHDFSDELAERTLTNYIKSLDPAKIYFLKSDVDPVVGKYAGKLARMIRSADCSVVDVMFSLYSKRFNERLQVANKWIDAKHDYTIDEYLDLDRKKLDFSSSVQEASERWRKRIKFQFRQLRDVLSSEEKARQKLKKRYGLQKKRQEEMDTDDVYGIFLDAFATALDPHSDYFSPSQLEEFRISTRLSLEGIGALLGVDDGFTTIRSLIPGGAAKRSGKIRVEDKIVAVAQAEGKPVDVVDMDLRDVVRLIRGPGGTQVRLTIRREGKEYLVALTREKIQLEDRAARSKVHEVEVQLNGRKSTQRIGVIDLPSFYIDFEGRQANKENFRSSSKDMLDEIMKLQRELVDAVVVDLRTNGGGSLDEAINVAGLFTGPGPVVQIKAQNSKPFMSRFQGQAAYKGPLVVVIDRQSASASEIFAGAIRDYERGIIVGDDHTFGKGTVQTLNDLDPKLGAIKVTISKFYTPSGSSTQVKGVESHITFPSLLSVYEVGEEHYDFALPWAKIDQVEHRNLGSVTPYLAKLSERSAKRTKVDKGFAEINEQIEKYNADKADRLRVALKEKTKAEKAKEEQERKEYEEKEKLLAKDEYGNIITEIQDDPHLMEAVYIASDYALLTGKKPLGMASIKLPPPRAGADTAIVSSEKAPTSKAGKGATAPLK